MKNQAIQDRFETLFKALPREKPRFGPVFRGWLENYKDGYKVYLRITRRYINGQQRDSVDLANIEVLPEFQRRGIFSAILAACENEAQSRDAVVFVESVLNKIVVDKLVKEGYHELTDLPNCFWKEANSVTPSST
jgi:ribosomal protein S18 acetylase RimI-like enzyme